MLTSPRLERVSILLCADETVGDGERGGDVVEDGVAVELVVINEIDHGLQIEC